MVWGIVSILAVVFIGVGLLIWFAVKAGKTTQKATETTEVEAQITKTEAMNSALTNAPKTEAELVTELNKGGA